MNGWVSTAEGKSFEAKLPYPLKISDGGRYRVTERRGTIEFGSPPAELHKGSIVRETGDRNEMYIVERKYRNKVWVRWMEKV